MLSKKKDKTAFFCTQCGAEHSRWQGQCRECGQWNTLVEEKAPVRKKASRFSTEIEPVRVPNISIEKLSGYKSGIDEFDRVLGGQLLSGMTVLLGGDPGIGKSTLLLQAAEAYSRLGLAVLYVTGEESLPQLKSRADRLQVKGENITAVNTTGLEEITQLVGNNQYAIVLIDSIQTIASAQIDSPPGTVSQIRESAGQLIMQAKTQGFALFLVGHVTKEGFVAGPKVLEHMVDTVVYFEGDQTHLYRMLRATKNRFGSVAEIGLFEMASQGLVQVSNPSAFFLSGTYDKGRSGAVITSVLEGNRSLLIEVQALVTAATYGNAQRVAGGIDNKKLALLLAILEKRAGYPMSTHDVFVSVVGGLKTTEPSLDLAILTAITSSLLNKPVDPHTLVVGEVGLSGEVRGVPQMDRRISEAQKLGYKRIIIPHANFTQLVEKSPDIVGAKDLQTALEAALG